MRARRGTISHELGIAKLQEGGLDRGAAGCLWRGKAQCSPPTFSS